MIVPKLTATVAVAVGMDACRRQVRQVHVPFTRHGQTISAHCCFAIGLFHARMEEGVIVVAVHNRVRAGAGGKAVQGALVDKGDKKGVFLLFCLLLGTGDPPHPRTRH